MRTIEHAVPRATTPGVTHLWKVERGSTCYYCRGVVTGHHGGQLPLAVRVSSRDISILPTGWSDLDQIRWSLDQGGLEKLETVDPEEMFLPIVSWIIPYSIQGEGNVRLTVLPTVGGAQRQRLFVFSEAFWGEHYRIQRVPWMMGKLVLEHQGKGCFFYEMCQVASYLHGNQAPWTRGGGGRTRERYRLFREIYGDLIS